MIEFAYTAVTPEGKVVHGVLQGVGEGAVALSLQRRGLVPLEIVAPGSSPPEKASRSGFFVATPQAAQETGSMSVSSFFGKPGTKDLIMFAENLAVLLQAGIPLNRSLAVLSDLTEKRRFRQTITRVTERIREGSTLWQALQAQGDVFPPVFVNMVRAGEAGGVLDMVLERVAQYLTGIKELKDYLVAAMIYPMILALTAVASMAVMLIVVVPRFAEIFSDLGVAMPLATRMLLGVGEFLQSYWVVLFLGAVGLGFGFRILIRNPTWGMRWDRFKLRLPMIGAMQKKVEIARFARTLGTLLGSGVSILAAMNIVKEVLMNRSLRTSLDAVYDDLKQGRMLSMSLEKHQVFPSMAVHLLSVGEETGKMEIMLNKLAEIYDKDLRAAIKAFTAVFEPAVILTMGLAIGMMVVSMLLAIFSINELAM